MLEQIQNEFKTASDLLMDTLDNGYLKMEIAYFPSLCDERIKDGLLVPFSYRFDPDEFRRMLHSNPKYQKQDKSEEWEYKNRDRILRSPDYRRIGTTY
jgi:spore germination protein KA